MLLRYFVVNDLRVLNTNAKIVSLITIYVGSDHRPVLVKTGKQYEALPHLYFINEYLLPN